MFNSRAVVAEVLTYCHSTNLTGILVLYSVSPGPRGKAERRTGAREGDCLEKPGEKVSRTLVRIKPLNLQQNWCLWSAPRPQEACSAETAAEMCVAETGVPISAGEDEFHSGHLLPQTPPTRGCVTCLPDRLSDTVSRHSSVGATGAPRRRTGGLSTNSEFTQTSRAVKTKTLPEAQALEFTISVIPK